VGRFLDNARNIFEAAENAAEAGHAPSDMTILIDREGGIVMLSDSDWSLQALQSERGARMAYRIGQQNGKVRLEGRSGSRTCLMEVTEPQKVVRTLLADQPMYTVVTPVALLTE
jgi:hypothetical protein